MNHSCDPTSYSLQKEEQKKDNTYNTIALKDLYPGDEITCDYNLFEYDCRTKKIDVCLCGSINCLGKVHGFKFLTLEQQKSYFYVVEEFVLEEYHREGKEVHPNFFYFPDIKLPQENLRIGQAKYGYGLFAVRDFEEGELISNNEILIINEDARIIVLVNGKRFFIETFLHCANRGNRTREFYYYESFQNHSCSPNTKMNYLDCGEKYTVSAAKKIKAGDEITCDYGECAVDHPNPFYFKCECGSDNCFEKNS